MGYNTDFSGFISVTPPLNEAEISYINDFADTRHTVDDEHGAKPFAAVADLGTNNHGNSEFPGMPDIWMNWYAYEDGTTLSWNGSEKTYSHDSWLAWIIDNLLSKRATEVVKAHVDEDERLKQFTCNHTFEGMIEAQGEDMGDSWAFRVASNGLDVEVGTRSGYDF